MRARPAARRSAIGWEVHREIRAAPRARPAGAGRARGVRRRRRAAAAVRAATRDRARRAGLLPRHRPAERGSRRARWAPERLDRPGRAAAPRRARGHAGARALRAARPPRHGHHHGRARLPPAGGGRGGVQGRGGRRAGLAGGDHALGRSGVRRGVLGGRALQRGAGGRGGRAPHRGRADRAGRPAPARVRGRRPRSLRRPARPRPSRAREQLVRLGDPAGVPLRRGLRLRVLRQHLRRQHRRRDRVPDDRVRHRPRRVRARHRHHDPHHLPELLDHAGGPLHRERRPGHGGADGDLLGRLPGHRGARPGGPGLGPRLQRVRLLRRALQPLQGLRQLRDARLLRVSDQRHHLGRLRGLPRDGPQLRLRPHPELRVADPGLGAPGRAARFLRGAQSQRGRGQLLQRPHRDHPARSRHHHELLPARSGAARVPRRLQVGDARRRRGQLHGGARGPGATRLRRDRGRGRDGAQLESQPHPGRDPLRRVPQQLHGGLQPAAAGLHHRNGALRSRPGRQSLLQGARGAGRGPVALHRRAARRPVRSRQPGELRRGQLAGGAAGLRLQSRRVHRRRDRERRRQRRVGAARAALPGVYDSVRARGERRGGKRARRPRGRRLERRRLSLSGGDQPRLLLGERAAGRGGGEPGLRQLHGRGELRGERCPHRPGRGRLRRGRHRGSRGGVRRRRGGGAAWPGRGRGRQRHLREPGVLRASRLRARGR